MNSKHTLGNDVTLTASEMGKLGAQARIKATTSDQRKAWARKAGKASGRARSLKAKRAKTKTNPKGTTSNDN